MAIINGTAAKDSLNGTELHDAIYGRGGDDSLFGNGGRDVLNGGIGNDTLDGGLGNDALRGGAGRDILKGGAGSDTLTGGGGADQFLFTTLEKGDTITDFMTGVDKVDVSALIAQSAFDWIGASAFSGIPGQGGFANGVFSIDVDGDRIADFSVAITGQFHQTDLTFDLNGGSGGYWDY
jgi:Ca2+-binding RTX toxin-like protein